MDQNNNPDDSASSDSNHQSGRVESTDPDARNNSSETEFHRTVVLPRVTVYDPQQDFKKEQSAPASDNQLPTINDQANNQPAKVSIHQYADFIPDNSLPTRAASSVPFLTVSGNPPSSESQQYQRDSAGNVSGKGGITIAQHPLGHNDDPFGFTLNPFNGGHQSSDTNTPSSPSEVESNAPGPSSGFYNQPVVEPEPVSMSISDTETTTLEGETPLVPFEQHQLSQFNETMKKMQETLKELQSLGTTKRSRDTEEVEAVESVVKRSKTESKSDNGELNETTKAEIQLYKDQIQNFQQHIQILNQENANLTAAATEEVNQEKERFAVLQQHVNCKSCMEREVDMYLLPCKHVCLCEACYNIIRRRGNVCPICRRRVTRAQKFVMA